MTLCTDGPFCADAIFSSANSSDSFPMCPIDSTDGRSRPRLLPFAYNRPHIGKVDLYFQARWRTVAAAHRTLARLDARLDDRETEADTPGLDITGIVEAVEGREDFVECRRRHTRAVIGDGEPHAV